MKIPKVLFFFIFAEKTTYKDWKIGTSPNKTSAEAEGENQKQRELTKQYKVINQAHSKNKKEKKKELLAKVVCR